MEDWDLFLTVWSWYSSKVFKYVLHHSAKQKKGWKSLFTKQTCLCIIALHVNSAFILCSQQHHWLSLGNLTVKLSWHLVVETVTSSCKVLFCLTLSCFIDPSREGLLMFTILRGDPRSGLITERAPWRWRDSASCGRTSQRGFTSQRLELWFCGWRTNLTRKKHAWCPRNPPQVISSNCM